ncbi:hypothetical protein EVAR_79117_1 [Eumeta japonica]|uniref:Uncharacterized protein n=1 Tax=Eumeta variegata TaxID=151549 RepID=A0A4C1WZZ4_EUMVA|nr:hypothetical protein EVAR_79117_1 [Eumeta japonica]
MRVIIIILALQVAVLAAPSEDPKEIKTNAQEQVLNEGQGTEEEAKQNHRHKRWYDYYGFEFPPINPIGYPTHKRDNAQETGNYGTQEEPFTQIYTRLQEIVQYARQPSYIPSPPAQIPVFLPVIFLPQTSCDCASTQEVAPTPSINGTSFEINNRFPKLNDSRQNWGIAVNNVNSEPNETDYVDDSIRPVNFDPVTSNTPTSRPPPQVEHGSSQAGSSQAGSSSGPGEQEKESPSFSVPATTMNPFGTDSAPTACDGAILSCCHQAQINYDCFINQGCQMPTDITEPCSVRTIRLKNSEVQSTCTHSASDGRTTRQNSDAGSKIKHTREMSSDGRQKQNDVRKFLQLACRSICTYIYFFLACEAAENAIGINLWACALSSSAGKPTIRYGAAAHAS